MSRLDTAEAAKLWADARSRAARRLGRPIDSMKNGDFTEILVELLTEAVATERETCAKIADRQINNMGALMSNPAKSLAAWEIAKNIRARNKQ